MVTKMLIQVISVVTLVFGTCYQSVQALASNTKRIEIQSARLIDKDNTAPATVKAGSEHELVVNLTINNKDGDHESGTTQLWVPEQQLTLLEKKATFEPETAADNARLVYEKLSNNQLQLSWQKVANTATFKVELPVRVNHAMTEMQLPIAVGSATDYLQPLTVLNEDATDDAVAEITGDPGLPGNILANLDQYLTAQQAQEEAEAAAAKQEADAAAQKEAEEQAKADAAAKAEAEAAEKKAAEKKAAEDKAKQEAEAKEQAEKDAAAKKEKEQQEADEAKETAKTKMTMKTRSAEATEESAKSKEKEADDKAETKGTDLGQKLQQAANGGTPKSFFNTITLKSGNREQVVSGKDSEIDMDVYANEEFELIYSWDMDELKKKLGTTKIELGDFYTFKIYGLKELDSNGGGIIKSGNTELATYAYKNVTVDGEYDHQEVTITFDKAIALQTSAKFDLTIKQQLIGGDPVIFEYNEEAIVTGVPDQVLDSISKSGKFVDDQIEWTVTLKAGLFSKPVTFDEITITDVLGSGHHYVTKDGQLSGWTITHGGEPVTGQFTATETGVFKGETVTELKGDLVITFRTKPNDGVKQTTFKNTVSAAVGEQKTNTINAEVSSFSAKKETGKIVQNNDKLLYAWQLQVDLANVPVSEKSLASMKIVDTLTGNHEFKESQLALRVTADGTDDDLSGYFKKEILTDGKQLELKVNPEKAAELASKVGNASKLYFSYQTVPIAGDITGVRNKAEVSVNGMVTNTGNEGTDGKGKLIVKNGKYDDSKTGAVVDWTLNVNPSKWEWSKLTVTDKLPEYISEDDLSDIKIGNTKLNLDGEETKLENGTTVKVTIEPNDEGKFNEILLTFENIKQAYEVKFTTTHAWDGGVERKLTNKATAITSEGYSETDSDTVTIEKRIAGNVFKDGTNQLANSIEAGKNHVQWRVGFGTRLDDNFSGKDGDINKVTIEETLNGGDHNYLSFPTKATDYRLYEIGDIGTDGKNDSVMGDEINEKEYEVKLTPDQKDQNKMTIEITFTGSDKSYKQLMLVFATPIDLDAWFDEDADEPSEMKGYEFKNAAKVSYEGFESVEVTGRTFLDKNGVYGSKNGTAVKDSRKIDWEAILNADGKRLTNVTITDELSDNHEYQNKEDIKLYTADVRHRVDGDKLKVEVVSKKAIDPADYTIEGNLDDPRTFLIKLEQPLTTALLIEYTTTRTSTSSQTYTNKVKLSSNEVLIEADAKETISASGEIWGFDARFKKIIGDDKDRPLGGATFKLQEKEYTAADDDPDAWRDATDIRGNAIGEITSPESGNFVIRDLKTYSDFRLIETASAEGYDHHIEPITFNKAIVENSDWLETKYYVKNWPVTKRTALSISKEVTGLTNQSFEFKVSAKIDGKLDTSFNGTYPIAQSNETVTFENGIVKLNLSKDQTIKITQLPVYLPGKDLEKRQYEIEEVKAETDNFETQVSVDNGKPVAGTTTGEIGLEDDGDKHTAVFFHNSLTTGNFILSKQVNEADEQADPTATFKFKVAATLDGQDYSPIREPFEAYRINANGSFGSKELVKFIDGQLIRVSDSDDPDVITLKANEQYMVKDLPEGLSLKATELTPGHYHVTSQPAGQLDEGNYVTEAVVVPDKTVSLNATITVANALPVGNLRLNKDVLNQKPGDDNLDFEFTLTIDGEDALRGQEFFEVTGLSKQDDVQFKYDRDKDQHFATLKLKHNDSATIVGLPKGVQVTVTEQTHDDFSTTYQINGDAKEDQDGDGPTVTIPDGKAVTVSYENTRPTTGKLRIEKIGENLIGNQDFEFKIEALDDDTLTGEYDGVLTQSDGGKEKDQGVPFEDGEADITLKAGQYLTITGLPLGNYVVSEKATDGLATSWTVTNQEDSNSDKSPANDDGYYQAEPAKVTEKTTPEVVYTNSLITGKLQVNKHVASHRETDLDAKYKFEIKATKNADKVRNNSYEMIINNEKKTLPFSGDTAELTLKHGEMALVNGLPVGVELAVKEILDEDSELVATWLIKDEGTDYHELTDDSVPEVIINDDKASTVSYKNTRDPDGQLKVEKVIKGNIDADKQFNFAVRSTDDNAPLDKKYQVQTYDQNGNVVQTKDVQADTEGNINIKLTGGHSAVIWGLPLAMYQVEEMNDDVDYMVTSWTLNHEGNPTVSMFATLEEALTTDGLQTVTFTNEVPEGDLRIEKIAEGTYSTKNKIEFTIRADDELDGEYNGMLYQTNSATQADKVMVEFVQGEATVEFNPGQYLMISGLPVQSYQVEEAKQDDDVVTTWETNTETGDGVIADEVTTKENHTASVTFTNRIDVGSLILNKWVASQHEDDLKSEYKFTLAASDDDIVKVADKEYEVKGHDETTHVKFDENGKAELTMIHDTPVTINGLPVGVELTVTETTIKDFVATWRVNNAGDYVELTDDAQPTITIDDTHTQVVSYKNTRDPEGQLQIEKQVTGAVADEDASYDFIIEALDTTTGETTPGDGDGDTTEQPTETEDGDGDTTEQPVGDETSTDTATETPTPDATNLLDLNGSYSVLIYQRGTDKLLHKDTVEFDKGQATLALKADQYAVVNGLPLHTYQVREVDPEVANMSTSWSLNGGKLTAGLQADAHKLTADGVMTVLFNNAVQTGDLSIEKQVTGAVTEADEQQAYDFTVTAYREAADGEVEVDTDYNQQHAATLTAANGAATTIRLDFTKGELAVSLKAGERLTIHNLDENRVVTVTETPLADFITTHRIGTEPVTAGNETRQITIGDDVTKHVTFINDKPATPEVAWLSLTKSVLGSAGETDRGFDFTVQLVDHLQQPITGIVKVVKTTATGTYVSGEMLFDDHGTATVTLQHNETVKLEVPNGAHYQIAETDYSADGYVTTTSQGGNPERTGLTVTGIAHQVDPSTALVVYYNRADTTDPDDELAHTDTEDDQAMPELVGPATDDGSGTTGMTGANPQAHTGTGGTGTSGSVAPQAYTSGSSKGILPQTGEFLRNHWVAVLGWLLLMVLIGMMVWRYRLNKES